MGGSSYIHDALQLRWAILGVEDARIARICGNEHASMEAAKRDPEQGWKIGKSCNIHSSFSSRLL